MQNPLCAAFTANTFVFSNGSVAPGKCWLKASVRRWIYDANAMVVFNVRE
jgi:hypothetical protein